MILALRFSRLEFSVKLWLSCINLVEYWDLSSVSANVAVAISKVNMQTIDWSGSLPALYKSARTTNQYIFTLNMANSVAETLNNS
jgi:hypothetical protein